MRLFHRHDWKEVERLRTGRVAIDNIRGIDPALIERLVYGVTTIVLRCACTEVKTVEVLGG